MLNSFLENRKKSTSIILDASALVCGLLVPFAFAPYDFAWLVYISLSWMCLLWLHSSPGRAFWRGWLFGLGQFVIGIHWIFYSLYYHGGSPAFLAVLMVFLLASYLALFPALSGFVARRFFYGNTTFQLLLIMPVCWLLTEWLRGVFLTGFPWMQLGYSQIDLPIAAYATLFGGLGVGYVVVFCSALISLVLLDLKKIKIVLPVIFAIWLVAYGLQSVDWVEPVDEEINVSLIQGNIPQKDKWRSYMYQPTLNMYHHLTRQQWNSDVIIWPETAIPDYQHRVTDYLAELRHAAEQNNTDVLLGLFVSDLQTGRYYNSVINLSGDMYQKRHLVPLGEYFPFRGVLEFFRRWINIPMSDIDSGEEQQDLINMAGQTAGVSICFEDAFDRDVMKSLPQATLLVNVSNDAWFEDSSEPWQHHQIARMRALETGRYMLRATNTGVSSVIDQKGRVVAMSPQFKRHVLVANAQPYKGMTPYVFWQNYCLISLAILLLAVIYFRSRYHAK